MQIAETDIKDALKREYGIVADVTALPGELDLNFDVQAESGRYVLKCMRMDCDPAFIEMQINAMDHIRKAGCDVRIPIIIPTESGPKYFHLNGRVSWLISFLPGTVMAKVNPWTHELAASIGESIARVCKALEDFDHPQLDRPLKWNLLNALWVKDHLDVFEKANRRQMVEDIVSDFEQTCLPRLIQMPQSPIYNDANDMNILVDVTPNGQSVCGLIDFGDMTRAPIICEPAIALAYAMMRDPDPIGRGAALLSGFCNIYALSDDEIEMILPLVKMRLANTVTNAAVESARHPDNQYLSVSEKPAWDLLSALSKYDDYSTSTQFRKACQTART